MMLQASKVHPKLCAYCLNLLSNQAIVEPAALLAPILGDRRYWLAAICPVFLPQIPAELHWTKRLYELKAKLSIPDIGLVA
jgi:hypothetical protein